MIANIKRIYKKVDLGVRASFTLTGVTMLGLECLPRETRSDPVHLTKPGISRGRYTSRDELYHHILPRVGITDFIRARFVSFRFSSPFLLTGLPSTAASGVAT